MSSRTWYFMYAGRQAGPVTASGLAVLRSGGALSPETLVWSDGMADWQPLDQVEVDDAATAASGQAVPGARGIWFLDTSRQRQGPLDVDDLAALATAGFINRTTKIWSEELEDWTPVGKAGAIAAEIFAAKTAAQGRVGGSLRKAASVAGKASQKLADAARTASTSTMEGVQKVTEAGVVQTAVTAGQGAVDGTKQAAAKARSALEKNWPKIQALIVEEALPSLLEGLEDDEIFIEMLDRVYDELPLTIRLVVWRRFFISFALARKNQLLERARERTDARRQASGSGEEE